MQREKLKLAQVELEYMEAKQMLKEKSDPNYQLEEFKDFLDNEDDKTKVVFPEELAEEYLIDNVNKNNYSENDLPSLLPQDSVRSSVYEKKPMKKEISQDSILPLSKMASACSDMFTKEPLSLMTNQVIPKLSKPISQNEKVVIDPITAMQIAVIYKKMNFFGINADKNRIKISTHKPIKKEDYLKLSQTEIDEEQYYRNGIKPRSDLEPNANVTGVKYSIFKARNGRIMILRKIEGGNYKVFDSKSRVDFSRVKSEPFGSFKRFKTTENDEHEGTRNHYNSIIQKELKKEYDDYIYEPEPDSDEEMGDIETKDEAEDYTEGFISRYRKRKGKKRGISDYKISVMV